MAGGVWYLILIFSFNMDVAVKIKEPSQDGCEQAGEMAKSQPHIDGFRGYYCVPGMPE